MMMMNSNQLAPNVTMLRAHIVQLSDELQQLATSSSSSTSTTSIANGDVVGVVVQIDGRVVGGNFSVCLYNETNQRKKKKNV